jgi:hypothetical protein
MKTLFEYDAVARCHIVLQTNVTIKRLRVFVQTLIVESGELKVILLHIFLVLFISLS